MVYNINDVRLDLESEVEAKKQVGCISLILMTTMDFYKRDILSPALLDNAYDELDLPEDPIYSFLNTDYHSEMVRDLRDSFKESLCNIDRFDAESLCMETYDIQNFVGLMREVVSLYKAIEVAEMMSRQKIDWYENGVG